MRPPPQPGLALVAWRELRWLVRDRVALFLVVGVPLIAFAILAATFSSAVIRGPSDCAGQVPDVAMADMAPSGRRPCGRIQSRLTILSDGRIVACEEDVAGQHVMGRLGEDALADVWQKRFEALRDDHRKGEWNRHPLCARCREWHRG